MGAPEAILLASFLAFTACDKGPVNGYSVKVPTRTKVERHRDKITMQPVAFETIRIQVSHGLAAGLRVEQRAGADEQSLSTATLMVAGGSKLDVAGGFQPYSDSRLRDATECVVQCKVTIFETDAPAEPHWTPESGQAYKVVWEKTFTERAGGHWFARP